MTNIKLISLFLSAAALLSACATSGREGWSLCGRTSHLRIVDLDVTPDPIAEGQQIRSWRVLVQADTDGECATTLQIQERPGNITVGTRRVYYLRPGLNEITVQPDLRYRFAQVRHCFSVIADIEGTPQAIDAAGSYCAQKKGNVWTMAGR
jgi:hypothetical protein